MKKKYHMYVHKKECVPLIAPEKNKNNKRLIKYLTKHRCINRDLVEKLIEEGYMYQDSNGNCVFVGFTGKKKIKHISLHTAKSDSTYKIDVPGSEKAFSFSIKGKTDTVYVFESTIDLLSYITLFSNDMNEIYDGYVALGGVGRQALKRYVVENLNVKKIVVCTDNDEAGNLAAELITKEFADKYVVVRIKPTLKDFNEDLCQMKKGK